MRSNVLKEINRLRLFLNLRKLKFCKLKSPAGLKFLRLSKNIISDDTMTIMFVKKLKIFMKKIVSNLYVVDFSK